MKILIIEDDQVIADFIIKGLKESGFVVDSASKGRQGLKLALSGEYDAAIIDIMLPEIDGLSIIEEIRRQHLNTPIIILSAKRSVDDRVKGLQTGSDDYLTKPFSFSELLARLQALIRRTSGADNINQLHFGDLEMNILSREVKRGGQEIVLQPKEFALLEYLMRNNGRVISKTMIMEHVWDYNFDPQTNVVEARICKLRDKIDRDFDCQYIHTIRGVGYALKKTN